MPKFSTICCDASFVVNWVTKPRTYAITATLNSWLHEERPLVAPTLLYYEAANALHKQRRAGVLTDAEIHFSMNSALSLPIHLVGDRELHLAALSIAGRFNLAASYDAHYLALAERTEAEFWTADRRLYNSVRHHLQWVNYVDPSERIGS